MTLFAIECTTCKARLRVRSADAIGQILGCPRCGSMVQVAPPSEWIAPPLTGSAALAPLAETATAPAETAPAEAPGARWGLWPVVAAGATISAAIVAGALLGYRGADREPPNLARTTPMVAATDDVAEPALLPSAVEAPPAPLPPPLEETVAEVPEPSPDVAPPVAVAAPAPPEEAPPAPQAPLPLSITEDWRTAWQLPLANIAYRDVPLDRLLAILADLAGAELTIDRDAWADDGISPRTLASVSGENTTLDRVLDRVLSEHGLAIVSHGEALRVTSAARGRPCAAEFDVAELAQQTPDGTAALAGLLRKFAVPASWDMAGGFGAIAVDGARLRVVNHSQAIGECDDFLRRLAAARREAASDPATARRGSLRTAWNQVSAKLETPISFSSGAETPASEVVAKLAHVSGTDLRIDRLTLEAAGLLPESPVALEAQGQPLAESLTRLLAELRWGIWPTSEGALILGSPSAAARRQWVEFYPVGDLLAAGGPTVFMERLVAEVAPGTWPSRGGPGAAYFDDASRTLIVRQSSVVHRQLEAWLATAHASQAGK